MSEQANFTRATIVPRKSPLLRADTATLTLSVSSDGKLRVAYQGWDDPKVLLPGEWLELQAEGTQVVVRREAAAPAPAAA